jgi:hypothetical protein
MRRILFVLVLVLVALPAWATNWEKIGDSADNTATFYIDRSSAQYNGSHVTFWDKTDLSTPQQLSGIKPYTAILRKSDMDCAERTVRLLALNFYDSTGTVVFSDDAPHGAVTAIVPDSSADAEREALCR